MAIYRVKHNKNYTVINNFICTDKRISFKAKGIWLYAFSRPDDWSFNTTDLVNQSVDGRDSVYSGLRELETFGYLERVMTRENGQFIGCDWIFYETPQEIKKIIPQTENPLVEKTDVENPQLLSTDSVLSTDDDGILKEILFSFDSGSFENIPSGDIISWQKAYPDINIAEEILRIQQWVISNPEKRKDKWRPFITGWLARNQKQFKEKQQTGTTCIRTKQNPNYSKEPLNKPKEKILETDSWGLHLADWKSRVGPPKRFLTT